jgi:hypothetical protein
MYKQCHIPLKTPHAEKLKENYIKENMFISSTSATTIRINAYLASYAGEARRSVHSRHAKYSMFYLVLTRLSTTCVPLVKIYSRPLLFCENPFTSS